MADAVITTTGLASGGSNILLRFLAEDWVSNGRNMGRPLRAMTDASPALAVKGQKVGVPVTPNVSSALLTDGNAKVLDDTAPTTVDVTLDKHRYVAFSTAQVAEALAGSQVMQNMLRGRINNLINDAEADVMSVVTAGLTTNVTGAYNTAIDLAAVTGATEKLDNYLAPENRIGLVRHGTKSFTALSNLAGFEQFQYTGQQSPSVQPSNGQGRLFKGVTWFKTQAMAIANGTDVDNCVLTPGCLYMAQRAFTPPPVVNSVNVYDADSGVVYQIIEQWNTDRLATEIVVHMLYGYKIVKETWGVLLKS